MVGQVACRTRVRRADPGGRGDPEYEGGHSDDRQSWGYFNRAREVYKLLGVPDRLKFVMTSDGHSATGPDIDPAWQEFINRWLPVN